MVTDFRETLDINYYGNNTYSFFWIKEDLADLSAYDWEAEEECDADYLRSFLEDHHYDVVHIFFLLIFNNTVRIIDEY